MAENIRIALGLSAIGGGALMAAPAVLLAGLPIWAPVPLLLLSALSGALAWMEARHG